MKEKLVAKVFITYEGYVGYLDNYGNEKQLFATEDEYLEYVNDYNEEV